MRDSILLAMKKGNQKHVIFAEAVPAVVLATKVEGNVSQKARMSLKPQCPLEKITLTHKDHITAPHRMYSNS